MKNFIFIMGFVLVAGCATAPVRHDIQKSWTTPLDFDSVWSGVISVFADYGIPIQTLEKDSGIIISQTFGLPKDQTNIDCGEPGLEIVQGTGAKLTITIRSLESEGAQITINGQYQQRRYFDRKTFYVQCFSRGILEQNFKEAILEHAAR